MHSFQRVLSVLTVAALLVIAPGSSRVNAQDGTPAATCDATFGEDAKSVFNAATDMLASSATPKAPDLAAIVLALLKIRQKYEDLKAPAGCEQTSQQIAQLAGLNEDVMLLTLLAVSDSDNEEKYVEFADSDWEPRFSTFNANLGETPPAVPVETSTGVCADAAYQAQIPADLQSLGSPDLSFGTLGTMALAALKLRYHYEDTPAPAGCEAARQDMIKMLFFIEDLVGVFGGSLADKDNEASYMEFVTAVVNPRGAALYQTLLADLGSPAAPPAATASS
jgi:hypothetical protein